MPSHKALQHKRQAFLTAYVETSNISNACISAGIDRSTFYAWKVDAEFAKAFEVAEQQAGDALEAEAARRAKEGVRRPVLYKGEIVVIDGEPLYEHEYSDTLLIFLLKGIKPEKYRERYDAQLTGKDGAALIPGNLVDTLLHGAPAKTDA